MSLVGAAGEVLEKGTAAADCSYVRVRPDDEPARIIEHHVHLS